MSDESRACAMAAWAPPRVPQLAPICNGAHPLPSAQARSTRTCARSASRSAGCERPRPRMLQCHTHALSTPALCLRQGMEVNVSKASTPADKAVSCLLDRIENDINVSNTGKKPAAWTQLVAAVEPTPPLATPLLGGPRPQASSGRPPRATSSPGEGS